MTDLAHEKDWLMKTIEENVRVLFDGQIRGQKWMKHACKVTIERIPDFQNNIAVDISFPFPQGLTVTLRPVTALGKLMILEEQSFVLKGNYAL